MADNNGAGVGMGLIAAILLVMLLGVGFLFATGRIDLNGGKDVNVNVDCLKPPRCPGVIPSLTNSRFTNRHFLGRFAGLPFG